MSVSSLTSLKTFGAEGSILLLNAGREEKGVRTIYPSPEFSFSTCSASSPAASAQPQQPWRCSELRPPQPILQMRKPRCTEIAWLTQGAQPIHEARSLKQVSNSTSVLLLSQGTSGRIPFWLQIQEGSLTLAQDMGVGSKPALPPVIICKAFATASFSRNTKS